MTLQECDGRIAIILSCPILQRAAMQLCLATELQQADTPQLLAYLAHMEPWHAGLYHTREQLLAELLLRLNGGMDASIRWSVEKAWFRGMELGEHWEAAREKAIAVSSELHGTGTHTELQFLLARILWETVPLQALNLWGSLLSSPSAPSSWLLELGRRLAPHYREVYFCWLRRWFQSDTAPAIDIISLYRLVVADQICCGHLAAANASINRCSTALCGIPSCPEKSAICQDYDILYSAIWLPDVDNRDRWLHPAVLALLRTRDKQVLV